VAERIQLSRTKGWRRPENTVVVSRPSKWGNPYRAERRYDWHERQCALVVDSRDDTVEDGFSVESDAREFAVQLFRDELCRETSIASSSGSVAFTIEDVRRELRGKNLACWCPLPEPGQPDHCHAAVLLEVANA